MMLLPAVSCVFVVLKSLYGFYDYYYSVLWMDGKITTVTVLFSSWWSDVTPPVLKTISRRVNEITIIGLNDRRVTHIHFSLLLLCDNRDFRLMIKSSSVLNNSWHQDDVAVDWRYLIYVDWIWGWHDFLCFMFLTPTTFLIAIMMMSC